MAHERQRPLLQLVEEQAGACLALSHALEAWASDTHLLLPGHRQIIEGYALQMRGIAEGLSDAVASQDMDRLGRFWRQAAIFGLGLFTAATTGAAQGAVGIVLPEAPMPVARCIQVVVGNAEDGRDQHPGLRLEGDNEILRLPIGGQSSIGE